MSGLAAAEICAVFNHCFALPQQTATRMLRGGDEPLFVPAHAGQAEAHVVYARGLAQSCLHEAAHWLYAGAQRRMICDYGYWYEPDGRDDQAQARFETHEIAIQAREWLLSLAAGTAFRVSADNLRSPEPSPAFCASIYQATAELMHQQWSPRFQCFFQELCAATEQKPEALLKPSLLRLDDVALNLFNQP